MKKAKGEIEFEKYSKAVTKGLSSYGIEVNQYGLGNLSATFPGGEAVEFVSRVTHDGGMLSTGFRNPYIEKKKGTLVVDNLQLLPILQICHEVDISLGSNPNPKYIKQLTDHQKKLLESARKCLKESGADILKTNYGVTEKELGFIETLQTQIVDNRITQRLKVYFKTRKNQDSKNVHIGMERFSMKDLYNHVENGTDIGKKLIEISRRLMEDMGEEEWERSLKF